MSMAHQLAGRRVFCCLMQRRVFFFCYIDANGSGLAAPDRADNYHRVCFSFVRSLNIPRNDKAEPKSQHVEVTGIRRQNRPRGPAASPRGGNSTKWLNPGRPEKKLPMAMLISSYIE